MQEKYVEAVKIFTMDFCVIFGCFYCFIKYATGLIPYEKLMGKAGMVMFSNSVSIINLAEWITSFNTERFFSRVQSLH
jgi:hypothetical protein